TSNLTLNGSMMLAPGSASFNVVAPQMTATIGGTLYGSGASLAKDGLGTLVLAGSSTLTGVTAVNSGVLSLTNQNALAMSTLSVGSAGAVSFGSLTAVNLGGLTGSTALALQSGTVALAMNVGANGNSTVYDGSLSGSGSVNKVGAGALVLAGSSSYSGGTKLSGGILSVANTSALGSGSLTFNGGTLQYAGGFNADLSPKITALAAGISARVDTGTNTVTFSGSLTGAGGLTKSGAGTLILAGTSSYSGGTNLSGGILAFANATAFGSGSLTFSGGTLQYASGFNTDLSTKFNPFAAGVSASVDTGTNTVTFSGTLAGLGGLTKLGAGTLVLSGTNSFTGATNVAGGMLLLNAANTLPSAVALSVASGATVYLNADQQVASLSGNGNVY
ncbi:MAG: hypothetical protein EBS01_16020, partial [Verrucomicrobia bacterium]|nr:hypothetical protein [Verrucomicrobiota bacterium]